MSGTPQSATASQTKQTTTAARGEIWLIDLSEPPRGREEGGKNRPALIVSVNKFNQGPAELVIVLPLTAQDKKVRSHIAIDPPEGGVKYRSFAKCEAIRSISTSRLIHKIGDVGAGTVSAAEDMVKVLLGLY